MAQHLAIVFYGFWLIFETMLAPRWDRKSIKNRSKKATVRWAGRDIIGGSDAGCVAAGRGYGGGGTPPPHGGAPGTPPKFAPDEIMTKS